MRDRASAEPIFDATDLAQARRAGMCGDARWFPARTPLPISARIRLPTPREPRMLTRLLWGHNGACSRHTQRASKCGRRYSTDTVFVRYSVPRSAAGGTVQTQYGTACLEVRQAVLGEVPAQDFLDRVHVFHHDRNAGQVQQTRVVALQSSAPMATICQAKVRDAHTCRPHLPRTLPAPSGGSGRFLSRAWAGRRPRSPRAPASSLWRG